MNKNYHLPKLLVVLLALLFNGASCWKEDILEPIDTNIPNEYLLDIKIPKYDPSNPEHFLINPENKGWDQINNSKYTYFFVDPGIYNWVWIRQSGTVEKPKYICLHNESDLHPAQLSESQQASVVLEFMGVSNWIVDRISTLNRESSAGVMIRPASMNIICNRMNFYNFYQAFAIYSNSSTTEYTRKITIQNCRIKKMSRKGFVDEQMGIALNGGDGQESRKTEDVHIVNNEIINCDNGIQVYRVAKYKNDADFAGLIISSNHIYNSNEIYTDGSGNLDPNGVFAEAGNGIDLKAGSNSPDNPVIISNNYLWGFRTTDRTNGGGAGNPGEGIVVHSYCKNLIINNNVISTF